MDIYEFISFHWNFNKFQLEEKLDPKTNDEYIQAVFHHIGLFHFELNRQKALEMYNKLLKQENKCFSDEKQGFNCKKYILNNIGVIHYVNKDYQKAFEYYTKAIQLGSSTSMVNLGFLYKKGLGVSQDYSKAIEYFTKATQSGRDGYMALALMYEEGKGVIQNYTKAIELYTIAINQGDTEAMADLADLYINGIKDIDKGIELYTQAIQLGNIKSMNNMGIFYRDGNYVSQDHSKSIELLTKAIQYGNSFAMNNLGKMYETGHAITQDKLKAVEFYIKAILTNENKSFIVDLSRVLYNEYFDQSYKVVFELLLYNSIQNNCERSREFLDEMIKEKGYSP